MSEFVSRTVVGVVGVSRDPVNANFGVSVADGVEEGPDGLPDGPMVRCLSGYRVGAGVSSGDSSEAV